MANKDHTPIKDEELVALHLSGDTEAFPELIRRYGVRIYGLAKSFCRDKGDAEDIAQNTFVKTYEALPKSKTELPFKPWLFQICVNLCRNHAKKKKSLTFSQLENTNSEKPIPFVETIADTNPSIEETLKKTDLQIVVKKAIEDLPPKYHVVIVLRYYDGLSYEEIAKVLKLPLNTVRIHLKRAKEKLKGMITIST